MGESNGGTYSQENERIEPLSSLPIGANYRYVSNCNVDLPYPSPVGNILSAWAAQPIPWVDVAGRSSVPVRPYYLNAPDDNNSSEVPVLEFIHGGFTFGPSYFPAYDGYRLVSEAARKGKLVIYAVQNYRPSFFGESARGMSVGAHVASRKGRDIFSPRSAALGWAVNS